MYLVNSNTTLSRTSRQWQQIYKNLVHAIEMDGWETGIRQFLASLPEKKQRQFYRALMSDCVGWRFILEPKKLDNILCLDTSLGSTALSLSQVCRQLSLLHFDPIFLKVIQQRLKSEGITNVDHKQICLDETPLPFPDGHFDGFILDNLGQACGPQALSTAPHELAHLHHIFTEVYRVLKNDGFSYISLQNKYGFNKLIRTFIKRKNLNGYTYEKNQFSLVNLKNFLHHFDFKSIKLYKLITDHNNTLEEIALRGKYRSFKNSFLFKEKMKKAIMTDPLGNVFAPSLGFLCSKRESGPNYMEELIEDLKKKGILLHLSQKSATVKRYYTLPGKVILSVGQPEEYYGEKIVILPLTPAVLERRRYEARTLQSLRCAGLRITSLIPEFYGEGCLHGQSYLVQQEMHGISIDAPGPQLNNITKHAVQILTEFHISTANEITVDDNVFQALFATPLHRVTEKIGPSIASSINRIEKIIREQFWGKRMTTVWLHGDFKIENVLINPQTLAISGIIDWDLSQQMGLPLLDLLYLIVYNRVICEGKEVEDIFLEQIISNKLSAFEAHIYDNYVRALNLSHHFTEILAIMFWIYHVAYRIEINFWTERNLEKMTKVLRTVEKILEK